MSLPFRKHRAWIVLGCMVAGLCMMPAHLAAQETEAAAPLTAEAVMEKVTTFAVDLDTVWVLLAAFLVFWMQAGFALVEAGLTRAKNTVNICMKNILDFCFAAVFFYFIGFAIMFGTGNAFMGTSGFMLRELDADTFSSLAWTTVPLDAKFIFQLVFAGTAATIVSGAMAERTKFHCYMIYSIVITALIYPVSGHWIWGGGWLVDMGMWDFAGSTVVHSVGGWLALCGAVVLGPRLGKYGPDGKVNAIPGHSFPFMVLGVFILWLGWFGFNPGSTMAAAGQAATIAHIVVTTNAAAAAGTIGALLVSKLWFKKWDASMAGNGALAGLVAITAPCPWVSDAIALLIGFLGGVLVVGSVVFIDRVMRIDDPVGAISVHLVNGAWGTLAIGLFASPAFGADGESGPKAGLFCGGGFDQLIAQAIGVAAVGAWCLVTGFILFFAIKAVLGLRVSAEEEVRGLDLDEHGLQAYPGFQLIKT